MLLAKSAENGGKPETLLEHSQNVRSMAKLLFDRLPPSVRSQEYLFSDLEAAALLHDIGKAAAGFQDMLAGKRPNWNGWRHEVLSAGFASNLEVSEEVIFAVLTHHRQIPGCNFGESSGRLHWQSASLPEDWQRILADWQINSAAAFELWSHLCSDAGRDDLSKGASANLPGIRLDQGWLDQLTRCQKKAIAPARRIKASLLRGLLMGADHLASAGLTAIPAPIQLSNFTPSFKLRGFQEECAIEGNVILDAPTGSGKTEAALLWAAANQPENGRFFYTLPYTAALNAMYGRIQREFPQNAGSIGLLHGRAAYHLYQAAQEDYPAAPKKATEEALARARLAKETLYPVRVCTPHQLLRFPLRGKGWEQMLSEIPGSCIVFDEVHSYDAKLAGLTLGTARLFASMGAKLMFISATLPKFMREYISQLAPMIPISPDPKQEGDREILDRKRHAVSFIDSSLLEATAQIVEAANCGQHVLVVCNHVASAQKMATALRAKLGEDENTVCLFHGRFNMRDRKDKEAKLSGKSLPRVVVATQVVEVSLDISFDVGFFEAAPIDALVQRMGRVNRQGTAPKPIRIARSAISPHQIYPKQLTQQTLALLAERQGPLSERDLTEICNTVYEAGYVGKDKRNFEELLNHKLFTSFEHEVVAGEHYDWIEQVIEDKDGRADLLPKCLKKDHSKLIRDKRWLDADALLINSYTSNLAAYLEKSDDPWMVNLNYDSKNGLYPPKSE